MKRTQLIGVLLWRGGLLLAVGGGVFESLRWLVRHSDLPSQLEVGFGLFVTGGVLFVASLLAERVGDWRSEEDLRE
jgi:hypothetical protein